MQYAEIDGPRACREDERDKMIALVDDVMRDGIDQTFLTDYPLVYQDSNLQNIFIIQEKREMASVVPYLPREVVVDGCQFSIGIISPTATSANHRKKGYASKCLNVAIEKMVDDEVAISILWTVNSNFPFYERSQFYAVRSQDWLYTCKKGDADLFSDNGHQVIEYKPDSKQYIADIQTMHENELFGILRAPEEYPYLFNLPKSRTLIALQDNKPVGYLMLSNSCNKSGLVEAGGDKVAVETLVNRALLELDDEMKLPIYGNLTPTILGALFEEKLPERRTDIAGIGMMVRINHAYGFMKEIKPYLEKRNAGIVRKFSVGITDTSEMLSFDFTEQGLEICNNRFDMHVDVSMQEFTSIVFGSHVEHAVEVLEMFKNIFPFYFPIWQLDHS